MLNINDHIVHDLTHTLDDDIDGFSQETARTLIEDGWNAKTLSIYSHAGTHMDAPLHFGISSQTIDQFGPQDLMGKAWIIDVAITEASQLISLEGVKDQLKEFVSGESLLIRTHWSKKYMEPDFKPDLPRISEDLANWCAANHVKHLGVEPLSVADVKNLEEVTRIHRILMEGKVIIIEGLKNLDRIKSRQVFLIALPLKVKNGDGAPARVVAFEEKHHG